MTLVRSGDQLVLVDSGGALRVLERATGEVVARPGPVEANLVCAAVSPDGQKKRIRLGKEQYINRLVTFVQDSSSSGRFQDIVGSHLSFLGDRLDSVARAAQKGSHAEIVSMEEADRYVVYTYLLLGDILSLLPLPTQGAKGPDAEGGTEGTV